MFGRRRYLPDINSKNPAREAGGAHRGQYAIQGSAADLVKRAMLLVDAALRGKYQARMLLQVHDELVLEASRGSGGGGSDREGADEQGRGPGGAAGVELGSGKTWGAAH